MKTLYNFEYEHQYWKQGIPIIAGVDEVGMGALAGPVCAGAVIFDKDLSLENLPVAIRDSKTLSERQRLKAKEWIEANAVGYATGEASVADINEMNIRGASHLAMRRAIDALTSRPQMALIDGNPAQPHPEVPAVNILDGDAVCFSIAAASILAKVHRDEIMVDLSTRFPEYGFDRNKGYGSREHLDALEALGALDCHRSAYAPVRAVL